MGHLAFFLLVGATCLLWSAACTAAAARVRIPWVRSLVVALGMAVPLIGLLPWLAGARWLAFVVRVEPNWFAPTVSLVIAAVVGGVWISRAGMASATSSSSAPIAARWPLVGLAALTVLAHACAIGTLLILDNAVAAEARAMRVEAATMMQSALPTSVPDADKAARLHGQASAAISADASLKSSDGPLFTRRSGRRPASADQRRPPLRPETVALITRHAATLETIRRAADIDGCRFRRDWTRPHVEMLIPELTMLRIESRLLAVAAEHEAVEGRFPEAFADLARVVRIGRHASSEPLLVAQVVGWMIEADALDILMQLLPELGPEQAAFLDDPAIRDLVAAPPTLAHSLVGEEAFGLATLADFADGRRGFEGLGDLIGDPGFAPVSSKGAFAPLAGWLSTLFRVFLLPADIAGFRAEFDQYRRLAAAVEEQPSGWPSLDRRLDEIREASDSGRRHGLVSRILLRDVRDAFQTQVRVDALHRAATVLVAAHRHRLATGALPESIEALVPAHLPRVPLDPFTRTSLLQWRSAPEGIVVWSVGPDGLDQGGPPQPPAAPADGGESGGRRGPGGPEGGPDPRRGTPPPVPQEELSDDVYMRTRAALATAGDADGAGETGPP
ncbi:MAG: hypothetical protein ACKO5R_05845 [Planctomycetaceae bacterium]